MKKKMYREGRKETVMGKFAVDLDEDNMIGLTVPGPDGEQLTFVLHPEFAFRLGLGLTKAAAAAGFDYEAEFSRNGINRDA